LSRQLAIGFPSSDCGAFNVSAVASCSDCVRPQVHESWCSIRLGTGNCRNDPRSRPQPARQVPLKIPGGELAFRSARFRMCTSCFDGEWSALMYAKPTSWMCKRWRGAIDRSSVGRQGASSCSGRSPTRTRRWRFQAQVAGAPLAVASEVEWRSYHCPLLAERCCGDARGGIRPRASHRCRGQSGNAVLKPKFQQRRHTSNGVWLSSSSLLIARGLSPGASVS
jgi:hypothetical protein